MLIPIANKQLNVTSAHASAVQGHSTLCIRRRSETNVRFSCRSAVVAKRQHDRFSDRIVSGKELVNVVLCRTKREATHTQVSRVLSNLDSAAGAFLGRSVHQPTARIATARSGQSESSSSV